MPQPSISDQAFSGLADAISDLRGHFEETVWGREVTASSPEITQWPQAREEVEPAQAHEQERDMPEPEIEPDHDEDIEH